MTTENQSVLPFSPTPPTPPHPPPTHRFNIMTYDFHGSWDTTVNYQTPWVDPLGGTFDIQHALNYYIGAGVPAGWVEWVVWLSAAGSVGTREARDDFVCRDAGRQVGGSPKICARCVLTHCPVLAPCVCAAKSTWASAPTAALGRWPTAPRPPSARPLAATAPPRPAHVRRTGPGPAAAASLAPGSAAGRCRGWCADRCVSPLPPPPVQRRRATSPGTRSKP